MNTDFSFFHFSDIHLTPAGELFSGRDTYALALAALDEAQKLETQPAFIIISGDLSTDETRAEGCYLQLNALLDEIKTRFAAPIFLAMGNHDERAAFRRVALHQPESAEPYFHAQTVKGLRVIVLDSLVPGKTRGFLDAPQLDWLAGELDACERALVVVHHSPIPIAVPFFAPHQLTNADALAAVIAPRAGKVMGVLSGHIHYPNAGLFAGTLAVSAPGCAFGLDPAAQNGLRTVASSGFSVCHIRAGQLIVNPIILPDARIELRYSSQKFE